MKSIKDRYSKLNSCFCRKVLYIAFTVMAFTPNSKIYSQATQVIQTLQFGNIVMTSSGGGTVTITTSGTRTGALINLTNNLGTIQPMKFTIAGRNQTFQNITFNPITLTSGGNTLTLTFGTPSPPPPYVFQGSLRSITVTVGGTINFQAGKPLGTYENNSNSSTFISVF